MTIHLKYFFSILLCETLSLTPDSGFCQQVKDTVTLRELEVKASFYIDNQGFKQVRIDSSILLPLIHTDLSTILSNYSTVFIKSYGNASLATPSFRGTSAHHTQVEWNGININSPMLGQTDLSQIPVSQFDGIEILYGSAGLSRTSGTFGGIINLVTSPDWNNRYDLLLAQTIASFSTFGTNLNVAAGNENFQSITKVNVTTSKNDFPFYNDAIIPKTVMSQQNGSYLQSGISEDLFLKIRDKQLFTVKVWFSQNDKDIPPINTNTDSVHTENQFDRSFKGLAEWKSLQKRYHLIFRTAFIDQYMRYQNQSIDNRFINRSSVNRFRFHYFGLQKLSVKTGLDYTYDWVDSDGFSSIKTRNTAGVFIDLLFTAGNHVNVSLVAREDMIDGIVMPFVPAVGVDYKPFKKVNLAVSANLAKNYRYPTLNDLYWDLYGNPDLKPELSYSAEGGITFNYTNKQRSFFLETELTGYYMHIKDMIIWTPVSEYIWKPENVSEVLSRGIETGLNISALLWKFNIDVNTTYNYCRSTKEKTSLPNDQSLGKQLLYVPKHTLNASFKASLGKFFFSYNFTFVSLRYTDSGYQSFMPGYNLSNVFFGKNYQLTNFILSLQVEINNLLDLDYQSINNRPMPGRNYALTIRGHINGKKKP